MKRGFGRLIALVLAINSTAHALPPAPLKGMLTVETGMHTAAINRVAVDAAGQLLVTASDDKTVRIWEIPSGNLVRILRPPVGAGKVGALYAVALSPDGATIAAAGYTRAEPSTAHFVYLFNRADGTLTGRIGAIPNPVAHLAYSSDGRYLALTMSGGGVRLYNCADRSLAGVDTAYTGAAYSAHFSRTGHLVTTCVDGFIRLYQPTQRSLTLLMRKKAPGSGLPYAARFSPDGSMIAVGYHKAPNVSVLSAHDLGLLFSPDTAGVKEHDLAVVAWSSGGDVLFAAGDYGSSSKGVWRSVIRTWDNGGRGVFSDRPAARDMVTDLAPLPDGGIAFGSADPAFGFLRKTGEIMFASVASSADFRNNRGGFLVSPGGTSVQFGYLAGGKVPAVFDVRGGGQLIVGPAASGTLQAPATSSSAGLVATDWQRGTTPRIGGTVVRLRTGETSRALALAPDGQSCVLGSDWYLRRIDARGKILWEVPTPKVVWAVNVSGNGAVALAAIADGTIRWFRMSDGKELLAFFPHSDRKRWAIWSPSGYYHSSAGEDCLLGCQVNNGGETAAQLLPAADFRNSYHRPDIIAGIMAALDENEAVRLADEQRDGNPPQGKAGGQALNTGTPPVAAETGSAETK